MATVIKRCACATDLAGKAEQRRWDKCPHSWVVRYYDGAGKQRERSYPANEKQEAKNLKISIERDKVARVFVDPRGGETLARDKITQWIESHEGPRSTKDAYLSVARNDIFPVLGQRRFGTVKRSHGYEIKKRMTERGLGPSRIESAFRVLNGTWNEGVRAREIPENVFSGIDLPAVTSKNVFVMPTYAQLCQIETGMPDDWSLAIWLMYGCGMRPGEALALNEASIRDSYLRISEQLRAWPNDTFGPLKHRKKGEYRDVPTPTYVQERIERHLKRFATSPDGYLFRGKAEWAPHRRLTYVGRRSWEETFGRHAAKAELYALDDDGNRVKFTPHDLRHCFASNALSNGVPITEVSTWMGHKHIDTTWSRYGHLVPSAWDRARGILDTAFAQLSGTVDER